MTEERRNTRALSSSQKNQVWEDEEERELEKPRNYTASSHLGHFDRFLSNEQTHSPVRQQQEVWGIDSVKIPTTFSLAIPASHL